MSKYVNRESVEEALFAKWEKERQHWIEYLKQYRATKEYSSKEQAVDNWLRGYGEAVEDLLAIMENTPAAEVVPDATDTKVGGKWIHVTERLPEDDVQVLVVVLGDVELGRYDSKRSLWNTIANVWNDGEVSHWMPLPELYETEKGGEE